MGHIAEAEVESGRIFAQRLARSPYLKSWDASWPDSGRGIAELRSARKYGGLNQRYFDSTSPPIEPRCTAADCAEVGLGSLGRRLREHCSGKPLLRPSSALVGKPVPVVMVNSMCLGNYDPRAGGRWCLDAVRRAKSRRAAPPDLRATAADFNARVLRR